jgi:flavin-dependent dehydrogenase
MVRNVIIVGGGTAGWITAAYMARRLNAGAPGGVSITVIESPDIGIIGVGEGTFPSIRKTLSAIGVDEAELIRTCSATFKQGIRFSGWRNAAADGSAHHYFHPFQPSADPDGLDLLPYWLLGAAGGAPWAAVNSVQKVVADACLAPKLLSHPDYVGPLGYAYHFDAVLLAKLLRSTAIGLGVRHVVDTVEDVALAEDGAIASLHCRDAGTVTGDLYIDCTGFRAQLIGEALDRDFRSRRNELFVDRALAIQLPYDRPDAPIASQTFATAQDAGWIWDIGLHERRGTGYVYSSDHVSDEEALRALRAYLGDTAETLEPRMLRFEAGYRPQQWYRNCVAIGLSAGFIEPLEATGIGFAEYSALMLVNLFPWNGELEVAARQFNRIMPARYDNVVDFIKLHYCLSDRSDTSFWRDNRDLSTRSAALQDRLERWRHRAPDFIDVDLNHDVFVTANWQHVLYGMDFRTDITAQAPSYRYLDEAKRVFADLRQQQANARRLLPTHRSLVEQAVRPGVRFGKH